MIAVAACWGRVRPSTITAGMPSAGREAGRSGSRSRSKPRVRRRCCSSVASKESQASTARPGRIEAQSEAHASVEATSAVNGATRMVSTPTCALRAAVSVRHWYRASRTGPVRSGWVKSNGIPWTRATSAMSGLVVTSWSINAARSCRANARPTVDLPVAPAPPIQTTHAGLVMCGDGLGVVAVDADRSTMPGRRDDLGDLGAWHERPG